ncbi:MAG: PEGA domain-containing protein [Ignavibacteria bacterium]|nr:PEGA domain-containing protein [Ignavibacteria bacterium]
MKKYFLVIITAVFIFYSGCATIFTGSKETIEFTSEPSGAEVMINNAKEGFTPLKATLKKGQEYVVEISKEGYSKKTYRLSYSVNAGWLILDIAAGLIGVIVDAITGNWYDYDINHYKTVLEKLQ